MFQRSIVPMLCEKLQSNFSRRGGRARLKASASKADVGETPPGVQIPPSPPGMYACDEAGIWSCRVACGRELYSAPSAQCMMQIPPSPPEFLRSKNSEHSSSRAIEHRKSGGTMRECGLFCIVPMLTDPSCSRMDLGHLERNLKWKGGLNVKGK